MLIMIYQVYKIYYNRENNKGTKTYEIVKAYEKFKKEGLEIAERLLKLIY